MESSSHSSSRRRSAKSRQGSGRASSPIFEAVKLNKLGKVAEILSADPKQASRADGAQQSTPLHLAARRGLVEIAKLLLQKGAELNEQDKTLKSALHWACSTKNSEMVRFLLEQPGIEVFAVDSKKRLPLHLAVVLAPKETVEALVQADDTGSHLNDKDSQGCTPLHVSIRYDNEAAETLLLQRKEIDLGAQDKKGRTPLHYACISGRLASVERLVKAGANIKKKDHNGNYPIHCAAEAGSREIVDLLVKAGADITVENNKRQTPMHISVEKDFDSVTHLLTQAGADVSILYDPELYKKRRNDAIKAITSAAIDDEKPAKPKAKRSEDDRLEELNLKADDYGFIVQDDKASRRKSVSFPPVDQKAANKLRNLNMERTSKWIKMLKSWDKNKKPEKLRKRVWKGIPEAARSKAWSLLLNLKTIKKQHAGEYANLLTKKASRKTLIQIDLDINRSARNHVQFRERFGQGQICLFNVLKAYSIYDPIVDYCQSMSDVAAFLLMYLEEEEAFWALVRLCQADKFSMGYRYQDGFPGLKKTFHVHRGLLAQFLPDMASQLDRDGIDTSFYTMEPFMRLFLDRLNFDIVLRVWDAFLLDGFVVIYKVLLQLLILWQGSIVGKPFEEALPFLQKMGTLPPGSTIDSFMKAVKKLNVKPSRIVELEAQYDVIQQAAASETAAKKQAVAKQVSVKALAKPQLEPSSIESETEASSSQQLTPRDFDDTYRPPARSTERPDGDKRKSKAVPSDAMGAKKEDSKEHIREITSTSTSSARKRPKSTQVSTSNLLATKVNGNGADSATSPKSDRKSRRMSKLTLDSAAVNGGPSPAKR